MPNYWLWYYLDSLFLHLLLFYRPETSTVINMTIICGIAHHHKFSGTQPFGNAICFRNLIAEESQGSYSVRPLGRSPGIETGCVQKVQLSRKLPPHLGWLSSGL
jgi:hypothetical protein